MNKILLSVTGPTAIGKTKLAILLAQHFSTEILSADSKQFFKEMAVGTAVPSQEELQSAPHHFIQHKSIQDAYSVGDFEKEALAKLDDLFVKNKIAVMVGGSGLYVDAITKGLNEFPKVAPIFREQLNKEFEKKGIESLQESLKRLDPKYYKKVDVQNPHRLIRALEICQGTGKPYSSFLNKPKAKRNFDVFTVGLTAERKIIYDRINKRVDIMMDSGLLEEVETLLPYRNLNALQTVGYKELFKYLNGDWEKDYAVAEIKKNTRRFAKRQLTWFKKNEDTMWVQYDYDAKLILDDIEKRIEELNNE